MSGLCKDVENKLYIFYGVALHLLETAECCFGIILLQCFGVVVLVLQVHIWL